ncbi:cell division protein FtsA [Chloroflexota bacterium]
MKRTRIASIDAGASKAVTVMADMNSSGNLRILGIGMAQSQGIERDITNLRQAVAAISQSVKKAEKMAGYRLKSACVGISGTDTNSVTNRGTISIPYSDQQVHAADRKRALDVALNVEVPSEQKLLHVIPRSYTLDGQGNIKNPVGMHGLHLNVEAHIVTATTTSVQSLTNCMKSLGIGVNRLVLKSLASAEAVLTEDEKRHGVMLADIGDAATNIAVFKDGSVYHTSTVPVGGHNVTHDIAVGLGLPRELAELVKKEHGDVMTSEVKGSIDDTVTESGHSISRHDLREIITARIEELLRLIILQLPQVDYTKAIPSGLVITGGSCNLSGIVELGRMTTQLPVRIGSPVHPVDGAEMLCDPTYATCVGLLYWEMKSGKPPYDCAEQERLGVLLPRWLGYLGNQGRRLKNRLRYKEDGTDN